jgi:hypothetical protein
MKKFLLVSFLAWAIGGCVSGQTAAQAAVTAATVRASVCAWAKASQATPELQAVQRACDAGNTLDAVLRAYAGCPAASEAKPQQ